MYDYLVIILTGTDEKEKKSAVTKPALMTEDNNLQAVYSDTEENTPKVVQRHDICIRK